MKLEDKYPILEQSKRIAELLGDYKPKRESGQYGDHMLMEWIEWDVNNQFHKGTLSSLQTVGGSTADTGRYYPAYDLAELGALIISADFDISLPVHIETQDNGIMWYIGKYSEIFGKVTDDILIYPTEAQARAALLIHLLESQKENN